MKLLRRFFYLLYYLTGTNLTQLKHYLYYAKEVSGKSILRIQIDMLKSVFQYNISLKDYFSFRFFELEHIERSNWAGTGFMYEYQLRMNPRKARKLLENKLLFYRYFKTFVKREFHSLGEIKNNRALLEKMMGNNSNRIVLKGSLGQIGAEVEVISSHLYSLNSLIKYMESKKYDLVEDFVTQHPELMKLSPSGLNTVRIITQISEGRVDILGARLRISLNSQVDNMAAGNLAAPIDLQTGIVIGPGVFSDITKEDREQHPITGYKIIGFKVPEWNGVLDLARRAALLTPENKSVGWDIAITENGLELIEGNHNWCKLLFQMPVKKGLKSELVKYL